MVQIIAEVDLNALPGKNYNPRPSVPAGSVSPFAQQEFSSQELERIRNDPFLAARIEAASNRIQPAGYSDNYKGSARNADARQAYNLATRDYKTFLKQELPAYINNPAATQQILSTLSGLGESPQNLVNLYESSYAEKDRYSKTESEIARSIKGKGLLGVASPYISIGLSLFAPGIGSAIGASLGLTGAAASIVGSAIVQGSLSEAQGGDFLDGAIKGAVSAGVAPAVANTVGATVSNIMADSAIKNVVSNAIASSASSAVTAALTGGDVEQAALTGALAGAGGSIGREFATAADLGTTPFSEQTQMLAGQEQGLGTAGGVGANLGQAAGAIASGVDPQGAILQAVSKSIEEQRPSRLASRLFGRRAAAEPAAETPVLTPTEAEMPPPAFIGTPQLVTEPVDATISEPVEIPPPSPQEKLILDLISQELGLVEGGLQEGVAGTIPEVIPGIQEGIVETTPGLDFGVQQGVVETIPEDLGVQPGIVATIPEDLGLQTGVAGTIPEDLGVQGGIVETIPEDLGLQGGVAETIPPLDQDIIDLITPPPATEENLALDVLGEPLTPEAVDIEPIPQDPLLGLSSQAAGEAEQEAIDYQALEGLSDPSVGLGEEAAIDQANLDALGDLSSSEVGQGEQEAIDRQALEELSSPEVGLGEQEAIAQATPEFQTTPFIRDTYISSGRRQPVMGPTVTTLGQAISAPFFPSSPVSGLTSYRGAGEIESKSTGKPRRDVWNEASLRLKDALGL